MEKLERCIHQIFRKTVSENDEKPWLNLKSLPDEYIPDGYGNCLTCTLSSDNGKCCGYRPVTIRLFEVKEKIVKECRVCGRIDGEIEEGVTLVKRVLSKECLLSLYGEREWTLNALNNLGVLYENCRGLYRRV